MTPMPIPQNRSLIKAVRCPLTTKPGEGITMKSVAHV